MLNDEGKINSLVTSLASEEADTSVILTSTGQLVEESSKRDIFLPIKRRRRMPPPWVLPTTSTPSSNQFRLQ